MKFFKLLKLELDNFGKYEKFIFPLFILLICIISFSANDTKIALISSICGICYTILAGKGKISCYFIGIPGTICYSYLAFINGFYGNLILYSLYYLPMEIIGIFKWRQHLKKESREIEKTQLSKQEFLVCSVLCFILCSITAIILYFTGGTNPIIDSITTVLSVFALFLTVRRCIEQWYLWIIVNFLSLLMWIIACLKGANCVATVLMWFVYFILAVYFLHQWKKELREEVV